jgi:sarcosine oxidase, subunit gamma
LTVEAQRRSPVQSLSPLHGARAEVAFCKDATRLVLRGGEDAARAAAVFGPAPPLNPLQTSERGARAAIWQSPDEWLLIAEDSEAAVLMKELEAGLADVPHGLVDVSHRQLGLDVSGVGAARLLNAGVPLDLDLAAFPVGMATRTLLLKADILLWRRAAMRFRLEVARSFSAYVAEVLAQAAADQEIC